MEKINFTNNQAPYIDADNLNLMQNNVEDAINEVDNKNTYSTEEKLIGYFEKKDGTKVPHYRKTIYLDALPNATTKLYTTGIANLDFITHIYGTAYSGSGHIYQMALPNASSTLASNVSIGRDNNDITITTGSDRSSWWAQITLEYIKTVN